MKPEPVTEDKIITEVIISNEVIAVILDPKLKLFFKKSLK